MHRRGYQIAIAMVCVLSGGAAGTLGRQSDAELTQGRTQFKRHNYRAALEAVDRYLQQSPDGSEASSAKLILAVCLVKLNRWDEGIAELKPLLEAKKHIPGLLELTDLHELLGQLGLERHDLRPLAVDHFELAAKLYLAQDDQPAAAEALFKRAEGFVGLNQWDQLTTLQVAKPADWLESYRLQRSYAVKTFDRVVALAGDSDLAVRAMLRKAKLMTNYRLKTDDPDTALKIYAEIEKRWPKSPRLGEALFEMGQLQERHRRDLVTAVELYRRALACSDSSPWSNRASRHLKTLVSPWVTLSVAGPVLPDGERKIQYRCRNVKSLSFAAYRVDLFELIRELGLSLIHI